MPFAEAQPLLRDRVFARVWAVVALRAREEREIMSLRSWFTRVHATRPMNETHRPATQPQRRWPAAAAGVLIAASPFAVPFSTVPAYGQTGCVGVALQPGASIRKAV